MKENIDHQPHEIDSNHDDSIKNTKIVENEVDHTLDMRNTNVVRIDFKNISKEKDQEIRDAMTRHPSNFKIDK